MRTHCYNRSCCALLWLLIASTDLVTPAFGRSLSELRISKVSHEVTLVTSGEVQRKAEPDQIVKEGTTIVTGANSRAELLFKNRSIARLSATAALRLDDKSRLELVKGALLIQLPASIKAKVQAGPITAAASQATALLEYQPPLFKFLVLEGTTRLYRPGSLGDSILVHAGQMIFGNSAAALADPVEFDIARFVNTCPLIQSFSLLPSQPSITAASEKQAKEKSEKALLDTNLVIFGSGSLVSVVDGVKTNHAATNNSAQKPSEPALMSKPSAEAQP